MDVRQAKDAQAATVAAATWIAHLITVAVEARGVCTLALSGGSTPANMLQELSLLALPWCSVHVFQVDERAAPYGDPSRNLTQLQSLFLHKVCIPSDHIHAMPVEMHDLRRAATDYTTTLEAIAGRPPVLDIAHLGLGADGHTASLVPDDAVIRITDLEVAPTEIYAGHRRLTLTIPCLARARSLIWLITGQRKAAALASLIRCDSPLMPASRLPLITSTFFVDRGAAALYEFS